MQTLKDQNHLIMTHHEVAWLLVALVVMIAGAFGIGYFVGQRATNHDTSSTVQSNIIATIASSYSPASHFHEKGTL